MTEEVDVKKEPEETKPEVKEEPKQEAPKTGFNFSGWMRGSNKREFAENISFLIIVVSAVMVSTGIGLGSFIQGTVLIAVVGAFFVMVGIVVYIASQFIGG